MSTSQKAKKVLLALGISKISPAQVIANSEHYVLCMTGNAHFPSPSPTLAAVSAQTTVLQNAYTLSLQRTKGSVSAMHVQLDALKLLLKSLVSYVEGIANADPVNAVEIAQSSGIPEKKAAVHTPKTFSVKLGKVKGSVMLNTKAVKGGVYIYQMTTDPNNAASWVTLVSDKVVKFTKSGLTSGVRYYFRVAVVSRSVQGDWSHELDLVVQ